MRVAKRSEEKAGADEQHEADRDLEDDKDPPQVCRAAARRDRAPFIAKRGDRVAAERLQNRSQAEQNPAAGGDSECKGEHPCVHAETHRFRNSGDVQERRAPVREQQTSEAPEQREQHRFGEPLSGEADAAGAEGHTHGHLAPPRHTPRQQEARHVRAGDEQHEQYRRPEQPQQRPRGRPHARAFTERNGIEYPWCIRVGVGGLQPARDHVESGHRLGDIGTGAHTRHGVQPSWSPRAEKI